jgi:rod shape-determining protein MreC
MAAIRTQREIRQRAPWWLAGLLFANFALMSYDAAREDATKQRMVRTWAQTVAYPVQRATAWVGSNVTGLFYSLGDMRHAAAENQQLRQHVQQMESELRETREKAAEVDRLRSLLDLKHQSVYKTVPARIIARDPSAWFDTVTIDKGRLAGVENNLPVVAPSGVVGRVVSTGPLNAQVMLVTDERSGAGAVVGQLDRSHAFGSIRGLGESGLLEMRYVSSLENVNVGDTVSTTGQDDIYPAGLTIGQVVEVRPGTATQTQLIRIRPGAGIGRLEELAVLLYYPPNRSEPDQSLPNVGKKAGSKQ